MIFDEAYDTALWFIVKADKRKRKEIVEFLKEIPEELLANIRIAIEKYKKKEFDMNSEDDDFYFAQSKTNPEEYFHFQIDDDNALSISKEHATTGMSEELFELMLFPVSREYAQNMEKFYDEWLGTLTTDVETTQITERMQSVACDEREYNLYNTPIGHFVMFGKEIGKGDRTIPVIKPVSLRKVPKDITINSLLSRRSKQE
ncbi:MAG: hypothetical protein IKH36_01595 [Bacilli bacterium]|nr:hypothetical protein [Bacilli bacterium]MBR4179037.1 hypothetical protein [Bacilli bacterium]MBR4672115.1 hypothetical protein [Bacilli bacterium]